MGTTTAPTTVAAARRLLGRDKIPVMVMVDDIQRGECGKRAHCVVAQALDRQFGLEGRGYVRVDANSWAVTLEGNPKKGTPSRRFRYVPPRSMMTYLRKFDEIGEKKGIEAARAAMQPKTFISKLLEELPIAEPATRERKDRINELRRERKAAAMADGTYKRPTKRYVGV